MGNFEKLVVLTVLFLSAIVLAYNLNDSDVEAGSADPSKDAERFLAQNEFQEDGARGEVGLDLADGQTGGREGQVGESVSADADPQDGGRRRPTLLDSAIYSESGHGPVDGSESSEALNEAQLSPYGPDCLVIAEGLREAGIPGMLLFDLKEGTTWTALAQHLYGDESYVALLQSFNEEMYDAPEAGQILVPAQDFTHRSGIVPQRRPRALTTMTRPVPDQSQVHSAGASRAGASHDRGVASSGNPESTAQGRSYTVLDGDSLSRISEKFYGTKNRWKELYEANRNVLDSPDWVKPGMTLIIPGTDAAAGVH